MPLKQGRRDNKDRPLHTGEYQRKDGKYLFKYYVDGKANFLSSWRLLKSDRRPAGTRETLSLRELEENLQRELVLDSGMARRTTTVRQQVERYLATKKNMKPNTLQGYRTVQNMLEKEPFYYKKLREVRISDAKLFLLHLQEDGKRYSTIKTVRGILRPAFQMAVDDDIILKNPFSFQMAAIMVNDAVTREAVTRKQMRAFLKFVHDDVLYNKYYEVVYILFHTGMRISEFFGLTLDDVDLRNRNIHIDHQLIRVDMKLYVTSTKTNAGTRVLPMSDEVYEMFQRIVEKRRPQRNEKRVEGYKGFLFVDKEGLPLVAMHWEHRFKHMVGRYNEIYKEQLPKITPHVCRHTFCSNMAKSVMNPKTLQYLMGHSDIGVTMNTYTHLGLEDAREEMEKLEEARKAISPNKVEEMPASLAKFRVVK